MKNRKLRIDIIVELIRNQAIGSQEELAALLEKRGHIVTQATLSRDLKMLRTTKVPTERGSYRYVMPDSIPAVTRNTPPATHLSSSSQQSLLSITLSGNLAVIKTRNGYASGMAYDIDMSGMTEIIGTIPGSDTIIAVLRDGVDYAKAKELFATFFKVSPEIITT